MSLFITDNSHSFWQDWQIRLLCGLAEADHSCPINQAEQIQSWRPASSKFTPRRSAAQPVCFLYMNSVYMMLTFEPEHIWLTFFPQVSDNRMCSINNVLWGSSNTQLLVCSSSTDQAKNKHKNQTQIFIWLGALITDCRCQGYYNTGLRAQKLHLSLRWSYFSAEVMAAASSGHQDAFSHITAMFGCTESSEHLEIIAALWGCQWANANVGVVTNMSVHDVHSWSLFSRVQRLQALD